MWEVLEHRRGDSKLGNWCRAFGVAAGGTGAEGRQQRGGGSTLSQERSQGERGHCPPCRGSGRFRKAPQKEEILNKAEGKQTNPLQHRSQPARPCTGLWAGGGTKTQRELHPELLTPPKDRSPRLAGMLPGSIPKEMPALM